MWLEGYAYPHSHYTLLPAVPTTGRSCLPTTYYLSPDLSFSYPQPDPTTAVSTYTPLAAGPGSMSRGNAHCGTTCMPPAFFLPAPMPTYAFPVCLCHAIDSSCGMWDWLVWFGSGWFWILGQSSQQHGLFGLVYPLYFAHGGSELSPLKPCVVMLSCPML